MDPVEDGISINSTEIIKIYTYYAAVREAKDMSRLIYGRY